MNGDIDGISYQSDIDGTTNKYLDAQSLTTPKTGFPMLSSLAMETDDVHILLLDWCSLGHCVMKPSEIFSAILSTLKSHCHTSMTKNNTEQPTSTPSSCFDSHQNTA